MYELISEDTELCCFCSAAVLEPKADYQTTDLYMFNAWSSNLMNKMIIDYNVDVLCNILQNCSIIPVFKNCGTMDF